MQWWWRSPLFCNVTWCSLLDRYQCLRQICCHFNLMDTGRLYISFKYWSLPMFAVCHILQDTNLQVEVKLPSNWKTIQNLNFSLQSKLIQNCPNDSFPKFPQPVSMRTLCFQGVQVLHVETLATFQCAAIEANVRGGEKGLARRFCRESKMKTCIMVLHKDAIWLPSGGWENAQLGFA